MISVSERSGWSWIAWRSTRRRGQLLRLLGPKLGVGAEILRKWIVQAQVDGSVRSGPTSEELAEIKRLDAVPQVGATRSA